MIEMISEWQTSFGLGGTIMNYKYLIVIVILTLDNLWSCYMGHDIFMSGWLPHPPSVDISLWI